MTRYAISYTRLSTPKQLKGSGYQRQVESAEAYCKEHGLVLDERFTFEDLGVSGYSGANSTSGALKRLMDLVDSGVIPKGTTLIVEALDRITRQSITKAIRLLMDIAELGLEIVTLADRRVWNNESMNDIGSFMLSVITLYRGYQESSMKSDRLLKTFAISRDKDKKSSFGSAPGWLYRKDKDSPWEVDEEKAEVVRKVFELTASGLGSKRIAAIANAEGWPVPKRLNLTNGRWHGNMPLQLLGMRSVLGEHRHSLKGHEARAESGWKGTPIGPIKPNYYPRIVSDDLYNRAMSAKALRKAPVKRDNHNFNIFAGVMYCGHCGAPIHRKIDLKGYSKAQLTCSDRIAGATKCTTAASIASDGCILEAIYKHRAQTQNLDSIQDELAIARADLATKKSEEKNLVEAITKVGPVDSLTDRLADIQLEIEITEASIGLLVSKMQIDYDPVFNEEEDVSQALEHLYTVSKDDLIYRAELHLKILRTVETIWFFGYEVACIRFRDGSPDVFVELGQKRKTGHGVTSADVAAGKHKDKASPRPNLVAALNGTLVLPEPRKPQKKKRYLQPTQTEPSKDYLTE